MTGVQTCALPICWVENWKGETKENVDFDFKKYVVTLNKDHGDNEVGSNYVNAELSKEMPEADAPQRDGYLFKGYYTDFNGVGEMYYDENMESVRNWDIENDTNLFACWEIIHYNIKYTVKDCDLVFQNSNPVVYTVEDEIIITSSILDRSLEIIWDMEKIEAGSSGDIEINGIVTANIKNDCKLLSIYKCGYVEMYLPSELSQDCHIQVDSVIKTVKIIGNADQDYRYPIDFVCDHLNVQLDLILINVKIKAPDNKNAISVGSTCHLRLHAYGDVEIIGGLGTESNGGYSIFCGALSIMHSDRLLLKGGDGANGKNKVGNQYVCQDGKNGNSAISISENRIFVQGKNISIIGGNGGNGSDATKHNFMYGLGGSGAKAIYYREYADDFKLEFGIKTSIMDVTLQNGEDGKDGAKYDWNGAIDPVDPIDPIKPDPIFPPNPPIITQ